MKLIYLNTGEAVKVDDADYERLNKHRWIDQASKFKHYACRHSRRNGHQVTIRMHREIMQCPDNMETDHLNNDTFDNQRHNLENVTKKENIFREQRPLFRPNNHNDLTKTQ